MTLPPTLPAKPDGFTKRMATHLNFGRKGASAVYEVRWPDGEPAPFVYTYTTGPGYRITSEGFAFHGSKDVMSWAELVKRWPTFVKCANRVMAARGKTAEEAIRYMAVDEQGLLMVVIYERPRDLPSGFVVRLWKVTAGIVAPGKLLGSDLADIEAARDLVPSGMVNIGRMPEDDPKIVEVWV